jgi:hypothetical protein
MNTRLDELKQENERLKEALIRSKKDIGSRKHLLLLLDALRLADIRDALYGKS